MPTGVTEYRGNITAFTTAKPPVVTSAAHGLANGDIVKITQMSGPIEVNNQDFYITNVTTNTFELQDEETRQDFDASNFDTYTSGGRWNLVSRSGDNRVFYQA